MCWNFKVSNTLTNLRNIMMEENVGSRSRMPRKHSKK